MQKLLEARFEEERKQMKFDDEHVKKDREAAVQKVSEEATESQRLLVARFEEEKTQIECNHKVALQQALEEATEKQKLLEARFEEEKKQMKQDYEHEKKDREA